LKLLEQAGHTLETCKAELAPAKKAAPQAARGRMDLSKALLLRGQCAIRLAMQRREVFDAHTHKRQLLDKAKADFLDVLHLNPASEAPVLGPPPPQPCLHGRWPFSSSGASNASCERGIMAQRASPVVGSWGGIMRVRGGSSWQS
jgi:hypothetical protein